MGASGATGAAGTDAAAAAGTDAAAAAGTDAAAAAGTDAAVSAGTEAALAGGAEAALGSGLMGIAGAAAPWALGIALLGDQMGWFADGGEVQPGQGGLQMRQNFQPGGPVQGPGGPTSDSIPAWLSNGEHVQNETSASIAGTEVLDAINQVGLMVRDGQMSEEVAMQVIGALMKSRGEEMVEGTPSAIDSPKEEAAEMKPKAKPSAKSKAKPKKFKSAKPAEFSRGGRVKKGC